MSDVHPPDRIDVSVIVVTWNSARWLGACLDALPDACSDLSWELMVIDNASTDDSAQISEEHAGDRGRVIRSEENLGFAGAVNRALGEVSGRNLLLLNPDCALDSGSVKPLIDACESEPDIAGAVPMLRGEDGSSQARFQFRRLPTAGALIAELLFVDRIAPWFPPAARYRYRDRDFSTGGEVEQPAFAAVLLQSRAQRRTGLLDEAFYPAWFDDVDYCRRLRGEGYRLMVVPNATARHHGGASLSSMGRGEFAVIWYRNMYRYARKWLSPRAAAALRWGVVLGMVIRILMTAVGFGRSGSDRSEVQRGWLDVLNAAWNGWETSSRSS